MGEKRVAVFLLNWNGWKDTVECLESLVKNTYSNYDILVVENGSEDGSYEHLKNHILSKGDLELFESKPGLTLSDDTKKQYHEIPSGRKVILIPLSENLGFAGGNELAYSFAMKNLNPDYIYLLNNDAVVDKDFLSHAVKTADNNSCAGSVQSKILNIKDQDRIDAAGLHIDPWGNAYQVAHGERDNSRFDNDPEIFGACGAAVLFRVAALKETGFLDSDFFAYYEDVDLAWRLRLFGWKSYLSSSSRIYHHHSASGSGVKEYYLCRNMPFYLIKNASPSMLFKSWIRAVLGFVRKFILITPQKSVTLEKSEIRRQRFKGWRDSMKLRSEMFRKRKQIMKGKKVSPTQLEKEEYR